MLFALFALPGVGLIVIVVVLALPYWVSRQCGAVKGAIGAAGDDVPGLRGEVLTTLRPPGPPARAGHGVGMPGW